MKNNALFYGSAVGILIECFSQVASAGRLLGKVEIEKLQSSLKSYPEMAIDFTQTQTKKLRGKKSTSLGKAYFKQPDLFRWQLVSPKKDEWIYDGKNLYNFIPDHQQASKYDANGAKGKELRQIVDLVTNFSTLSATYDFGEVKEEGELLVLSLTPKLKGELNKVELTVSKMGFSPKSLVLQFQNDNPTRLDFSNLITSGVASSIFSIPKGVAIEAVK